MVFINIIENENDVVAECRKHEQGPIDFCFTVDKITHEVISKTAPYEIDMGCAYGVVVRLMETGNPLPKTAFAAWG